MVVRPVNEIEKKSEIGMNQKLAAKKEDSRKHCQDSANVHLGVRTFPLLHYRNSSLVFSFLLGSRFFLGSQISIGEPWIWKLVIFCTPFLSFFFISFQGRAAISSPLRVGLKDLWHIAFVMLETRLFHDFLFLVLDWLPNAFSFFYFWGIWMSHL